MSKNLIPVLRWSLTIPSSIVGFYFALLLGIASHDLAMYFCPDSDLVSGMCMAAYMQKYEHIAMVLFPTVAAILVVLFPYLVAPKHKSVVVIICYFIGTATAVYFAFRVEGKLLLTLFSAVLFSGLVVLALVRSGRRTSSSNS